MKRRRRSIMIGVLSGMFATTVCAGMGAVTSSAAPLAGSAGTDTSLPATTSAVQVHGRGEHSGLTITVNQTRNLSQQAVSLAWSGGEATFTDAQTGQFNGNFSGNYLQIFQCWGDDDGSFPDNPGPPPQQCEFGGQSSKPVYPVQGLSYAYTRVVSSPSWTCGLGTPVGCIPYAEAVALASTSPDVAHLDPTGFVLSPFKAVDATAVPATVNYNAVIAPLPQPPYNTNPFFDHNTSNEVPFSRTFPDGGGQELFRVLTGLEAPGLGCGQESQKNLDGTMSVPKCWLVVVPRGTPAQENMTGDGSTVVNTSPLTPTAWRNRIAIPLEFNAIGSSCDIGSKVRRISGGELAATAAASWQPALCAVTGAPPYSYGVTADERARAQVGVADTLAVTSKPVEASRVDPSNPVLYAPIALSGVVVGFNIQRVPALTASGTLVADQVPIAGRRVTKLQLTPRLVAKLLTQSYTAQYFSGDPKAADHAWQLANARTLIDDPDFLRYNPEFTELRQVQAVDASGLVVDAQTSDAASAVWQWIMSDPEAKSWLSGVPDPSGMRVNPYFSMDPVQNPSGTPFGDVPLNSFPKNDPYCWTPPSDGFSIGNPPKVARPLCSLDWSPYVSSLRGAAAATRAANSGSKTELDLTAAESSSAWKAAGPQIGGTQFVLSITDAPSAARFGLQTALLSRAGDDGTDRSFVAPDGVGLLAGLAAMKPSGTPSVLSPDPSATQTGAYPLTMLTYAATTPLSLSASARHDYSLFVSYAVGDGQRQGYLLGNLPEGYVPLPASLIEQSAKVAALIADPSSLVVAEDPDSADPVTPAPTPTEPVEAPARALTTSGVASLATTATTIAPTAATTAPKPTLTPVSTGPTPRLAVGIGRWALPFGVGSGLICAVASEVIVDERRRTWLKRLRLK